MYEPHRRKFSRAAQLDEYLRDDAPLLKLGAWYGFMVRQLFSAFGVRHGVPLRSSPLPVQSQPARCNLRPRPIMNSIREWLEASLAKLWPKSDTSVAVGDSRTTVRIRFGCVPERIVRECLSPQRSIQPTDKTL